MSETPTLVDSLTILLHLNATVEEMVKKAPVHLMEEHEKALLTMIDIYHTHTKNLIRELWSIGDTLEDIKNL